MIRRWLMCAALLAPACSAPEPEWTTVFDDLDRVALSVWSDGPDVYVVGGGLDVPGLPTLVLQREHDQWRELALGGDKTMWWVTGVHGDATDVWMVGEAGSVVRWNGSTFTTIASPVESTLFGAWAAAPDDVWIVGGAPGMGNVPDNDVVLHWDGHQLVRDSTLPRRGVALLKIWGSSPDDLWIVGEQGTLWHRTASGWEDHAVATASTLFSVHGCDRNDIYAVGGSQILHFDGATWAQVGPPIYAAAVGVVCGPEGAVVTGSGGLKLRWERRTDEWFDEQLIEPWETDFHAAAMDADGGTWAVGGNYNEPSGGGPRIGVVAYYGMQRPLPDGGAR